MFPYDITIVDMLFSWLLFFMFSTIFLLFAFFDRLNK